MEQKNKQNVNNSFVKEVAKYFMNFLETDFKKRRIPKRNTVQKTRDGLKVGLDLEKYPNLKEALVTLLNNGFKKEGFKVKKGKYTANIPKSLVNLIINKIKELSEEDLSHTIENSKKSIKDKFILLEKEYDKFLEDSKESVKNIFAKELILPFLNDLDKPLENLGLANENGKYQLEIDITDFIFSIFENKLEEVLQSYFQAKQLKQSFNFKQSIGQIVTIEEIQEKLILFFENIAISDAFDDIYSLYRNNKLVDKTDIYLYFYEISINNDKFPVFYIPVTIKEKDNYFELKFDKKLFVNTKATDFIIQQFNLQNDNQATLSGQFERILYLSDDINISEKIKYIIKTLDNFLQLNGDFDLQCSKLKRVGNLSSALSNRCYFYIFDKSDEALINDYEEILNDDGVILENFSNLLNGFIEDNPKPFMEEIDDEWYEKSTPQKLTIESPIPLNDEQKQVLMALQKPDCKFLILEGPPGTGKSHTITAIICKALLEEKSVLVLSDKKEALDVVEDKILETLDRVRREDNFQNPILRLGKSGNKFYKIVSGQTTSKIRDHYRAYKHKEEDFISLKQKTLKDIVSNLKSNISFFENIKMEDIVFYFENIGVETSLLDKEKAIIRELEIFLDSKDFQIEDLEKIQKNYSTTKEARKFFDNQLTFEVFNKFSFTEALEPSKAIGKFKEYIEYIEKLKKPIIGYLFQKEKISTETQGIKEYFPFFNIEFPEKELSLLKKVYDVYHFILSQLGDKNDFQEIVKNLNLENLKRFERIERIDGSAGAFLKNKNLKKYLQLRNIRKKLEIDFKNQPKDIYSQSIRDIEDLVAAQMTHFLDKRVINYVDGYANEANNLKTIIRKKKKFPKGLFANLKKAFPCILSGIRDYAEFIPLEKNLFDLIIIDEASQVSIAQALPALIRGKKVVILGDDKQFSNVKSNNASTLTNQQHKNRVHDAFVEERIDGEDQCGLLNKVKENFDIKNSILKFTKFIRNYECLLKKHFRCYPEIISYSDKYFYGNNLQCMKIRGKRIEDVIKFDVIEHDGKFDKAKNTNELEVDFIIKKLKEFKEDNIEQSIGIITPHREQVSLLLDKINNIPEKDWLFEKCKLKIMTFDTCQGEERDYIFYSMVATREKDRLNWIFLKDFSSLDEEADGTIRAQRLNVGFSRAKECIHFVLSKPVEEFAGEIKNAMFHYQGELEAGKKKIIGGTDENSGMEHKIQQYFYETKFYKENKDNIEFIPQFELGKYLKQLDKTYHHPNYKVDFLLIFNNQKIVIEYDGFREHFTDLNEVNEINYSYYMKDDDIYRQKVLEGYGYRFLRINRFNIGDDPIENLSARLENLVKKNSKIRPS